MGGSVPASSQATRQARHGPGLQKSRSSQQPRHHSRHGKGRGIQLQKAGGDNDTDAKRELVGPGLEP